MKPVISATLSYLRDAISSARDMNAVTHWIEAAVEGLPLPLLEVWGRLAYLIGFALAISAFGGFTFRPGGRWGFGRERQAWDAQAVLSIPITFILIILSGYLGSFIVLVPEAQTFESVKDLMVFLCIVLFGYPALLTVPFAYGVSDLIEGVPPNFLLNWLPGYFINPACFWVAYQLFGRNPDFRRARTWAMYALFVLSFLTLEPMLWGYICAGKFTSAISYPTISSALFFTTGITWIMAPPALMLALPCARKWGMFWAEIPGHVKERVLGSKEWIWESGAARPGSVTGGDGWPIRLVLLGPFIALMLLMVGLTAYVSLRSAGEDAKKLATRLHEEIAENINLRLDEYLARTPESAVDNAGIGKLLKDMPISRQGLALIVDHAGNVIASSFEGRHPVTTLSVDGFKKRAARPMQLAASVQYDFYHVTAKPLSRETWLARATAYQDQRGGHADWVVLTVMPESYYLAGVQTGSSRSAIVFAVALLVTLAVAAFFATTVTNMLRRICLATQALANGDLARRVPGSRLEDLGMLAEAFNHMAGQLEKAFADRVNEVETRKRRERELEERETQLRTVSDNLPDGMIYQVVRELDGTMRFVYVSAGVQRLNGLSPEDVVRDSTLLYQQLVEEDRSLVAAAEAESRASMGLFDVTARLRRPDGEIRWMHIRSSPRRLQDGRILWDGIVTDVTARRQVEDALSASEEKFAKVFRTSPVAIALTRSRDGRWLDTNEAMEKFLGFSREEMIGRTSLELCIWSDPADRERGLKSIRESGRIRDQELVFRTKQGEEVVAQFSAELIEINGETCVLAALMDITARKRAQDELRLTNRALKTLSTCNQVLVRAESEMDLLRDICRVVVEESGYQLAWVGYARDDEARTVEPVACAGFEDGYLEGLKITWADTERGRGPTGKTIRTGSAVVCHDFGSDPQVAPWREEAIKRGINASLTLPLKSGGSTFGALCIYSPKTNAFNEWECKLLSELAEDLAYGVQSLRMRDQRRQAEEEVRRLLQQLGERVKELTALHSVARLLQGEGPFDEALLAKLVALLPPAWQFPEICIARVACAGLEASSRGWRDTPWRQCAGFTTSNGLSGLIEVAYLEERPPAGEGPFLVEERALIESLADMLTAYLNRRQAEQSLLEVNQRYVRHEAALTALTRTYAFKPENLKGALHEITEVVAHTLKVERVGIWRLNSSRNAIRCIELFDPNAARQLISGDLTRQKHPAYFAAMDESDAIVASDANTDHRTASLTEVYLLPLAIASVLDLPLHCRGKTMGVLCCEHIGQKRAWTPDEQTFAIAVANLVSMLFAHLEQQELETQLQQAQKLKALGTLAGGIAHDFNNILGAIVCFTELAQMDHAADKQLQDYLNEILKASSRASSLVRQILSFSRQQKPERRVISIGPVVNEVLKLLRSTLPSTIDIQTEEEPGLPEVLADPSQIHQIMMNLCANAAHAMRGQQGRLTVKQSRFSLADGAGSSHPDLRVGDYVQLTVTDTGHGMDRQTLERIFEPFFTTKGPGEGTGLGLAVVHGIIEDHDGVISVTSEPGKGTTFIIFLPAIASQAVKNKEEKKVTPLGRGERIMFVDDEAALCAATRDLLIRLGYVPVVFSDSGDAWSAFQKEPNHFAAVLTDLTMPGMTGLELAQKIRSIQPATPIILSSGSNIELTNLTLEEHGIQMLLRKPLDSKEFATALNNAIQRRPKFHF